MPPKWPKSILYLTAYLEGPYKRVLRVAIEHNKDNSCVVF